MNRTRLTTAAATAVALVGVPASGAHLPLSYPPGVLPAAASRPAMGWNSWNAFGCNITERDVERQADALVSSGLAGAGYRTVTVDDCWFAPTRAPDGSLRADPSRFPSGMAALGAYLHARGLRFGLYESPGARTCAQLAGTYPGATGSAGHETQDAKTFAAWGVDYLKYDWCSAAADPQQQIIAFTTMRDALGDTGRPVEYAINPNSHVADAVPGRDGVWSGVANQVRVTNDVVPAWRVGTGPLGNQGIAEAIDQASAPGATGATGDLDMLVAGLPGVSDDEARTQVAMWSMLGSPLIAGNDLTRMPSAVRNLLADRALIALDQDASAPAHLVGDAWVRRLSGGRMAVAFVNDSDHPARVGATPSSLGWSGPPPAVTDLWSGTSREPSAWVGAELAPHATAIFDLR
ncbi:glycoside hydrolase family 27 protein [Tsukamurella sp. 8F]|uniref:glycoside hydrolase family 27 protein n=1 Tax=unclassified Tsukamurella TaxID=2633480 RepID=UPI0023B8F48D|nr:MULTISPECIES: glycoside hydrolase family 27 protein [unclassified Tsukamurella]MDF0530530.1 glycoside hydrolase family 27 protein [Tsukamurella sp. 8J]MDF0586820.1 glycoside hydrolase family 27 protein [Tsukamurella sp. 8F]